jgi:lipoprotein-anchoring transpeptidase ErfK/SrfK
MVALGGALGALALLVGCAQTPGSAGPVQVTLRPGPGTAVISPAAPVSVMVTGGELREVTLNAENGPAVPGTLSEDRTRWTPSAPLRYGTAYSWAGSATGGDGRAVPVAGRFRTVEPASLVGARFNVAEGAEVGVAAPVIVQFDGHVTDRAAAERALTVHTSQPTEGGWGWLQDDLGGSRVFWRPKEYWKPGTQVEVAARLYGVDLGAGAFGERDVSTTFAVGRSQVVKADVHSHRMVVLRDGAEVANFEASYGEESDPNRNTTSGIHVVTEKFTDKRMTSQEYDYDVVEKWAVRISNNGEFIHANPDTVGAQGRANVSHGCVNLSTPDAKAYYDSVLYGDPVEVTGSRVPLSAKDGDIWVWTLDWPAWQQLSAVATAR